MGTTRRFRHSLAHRERAGCFCESCVNTRVRQTDKLADAERRVARLEQIEAEAAMVLSGFEKGVFVRDVRGDGASDWAVKLMPFLAALGRLQQLIDQPDVALSPEAEEPRR